MMSAPSGSELHENPQCQNETTSKSEIAREAGDTIDKDAGNTIDKDAGDTIDEDAKEGC